MLYMHALTSAVTDLLNSGLVTVTDAPQLEGA